MNVTLQPTQTGKAELRIAVEWADVAADYDDLLTEYAKLAVPGFRPGKAPHAMVEQRFRTQLRDDLAARSGRRLTRQALRERQLRAAGPIEVIAIQLEPHRAFSFTAEFVPAPKLELPDYRAIPLAGPTDDRRRDELSEWLLAHTPGDVPEPLIRQECERGEWPTAGAGSDAWQAAAQRVKLTLILEQIAEAEGIELEEAAVDGRVEKMAAQCGVKPAELRRQLGEDGLSRLRSLLRAEQALDYLLANAPARSNVRQTPSERGT